MSTSFTKKHHKTTYTIMTEITKKEQYCQFFSVYNLVLNEYILLNILEEMESRRPTSSLEPLSFLYSLLQLDWTLTSRALPRCGTRTDAVIEHSWSLWASLQLALDRIRSPTLLTEHLLSTTESSDVCWPAPEALPDLRNKAYHWQEDDRHISWLQSIWTSSVYLNVWFQCKAGQKEQNWTCRVVRWIYNVSTTPPYPTVRPSARCTCVHLGVGKQCNPLTEVHKCLNLADRQAPLKIS